MIKRFLCYLFGCKPKVVVIEAVNYFGRCYSDPYTICARCGKFLNQFKK